jgi:formylglycine-generating enzyme required for sulfatase activity
MTAGAQNSGTPTLAVFVVGMDNTLGNSLATELAINLTGGGRYTSTTVNISGKLAELQSAYTAGGGSSINRNALAEWGRANGVSAICLVVDDVKGNDHLFSAQFIDAKDSKLEGQGRYTRTGVAAGDVTRIALVLSEQLKGTGRRHATAPARSYPAELDIEMVFVEGGTFQMGCIPSTRDGNCNSSELPLHDVTVSNFYISKYEITQAQWKAVMGSNPSCHQYDDQSPVNCIAHEDITASDIGFLARLNAWTKKNYRLPTEAEWEYAARGGKYKNTYMYSGSNNLNEVAWYSSNTNAILQPVGGRKSNELGIYDMTGNAWELCSDWYSANYNAAIAKGNTNPKGPDTGTEYVRRSGGLNNEGMVRIAYRIGFGKNVYNNFVASFRVVLPAQ